jgi:glycosyltransferase involved in cell wall biosynthesis
MARVSVIIPAFNYAHFLGETIQSVLGQTFKDFELIVVDDGSTDNTREVVNCFKDSRIRYIYQENRGLSAAENTGIIAAHGQYIAILGADDLWLPENLGLKVKLLDARPDVALVCSDAYYFNSDTGAIIAKLWREKPFYDWCDPQRAVKQPLKEMLYRGCFIQPMTTLIRREAFDEVGLFDESLKVFDDWDMFARIVRRFPMDIIDSPLVKIRRHGDNMSTSDEKMYPGEYVVLRKALSTYSLSGEEIKLVKNRQKLLAPNLLRYGRNAIRIGKISEGRKALIYSLKLRPLALKPYVHLVLSVLGLKGILTIRAWKNRLVFLLLKGHVARTVQSTGR